MNIETLRKMRNNSFSKIDEEMKKVSNPSASYVDDRIWKLEPDKAGNASAIIRFLPETVKEIDGKTVQDDLPWIKMYNHGFKGSNGRWFIQNCPTTIGKQCFICSKNSEIWSEGSEQSKAIVRSRKRQLKYYANVLILADPANPQNEGQVKIMKFGSKIFDKIMDQMNPTFEDDEPINVFDYWEGADFKVRQRMVEGYPNFDQSMFLSKREIGNEDFILDIASKQHLLKEFIDPKHFKSEEELMEQYNAVVGETSQKTSKPIQSNNYSRKEDSRHEEEFEDVFVGQKTSSVSSQSSSNEEDDDDALAYFRRIAEED